MLPASGAPRPVVVITGGTEGIGRALAERFAANRHDLLLIARNADALAAAAAEIEASTGAKVFTLAQDLTAVGAADAVERALDQHGATPAVLINNAGIGYGGAFSTQDEAQIAQLIGLNITALTLLTRRLLPRMIARGTGTVINVASLGGFMPGPYQATYYASKAYVISLTRAMAHELRGTGVRVIAVTPGPVATAFHARMGAQSANYLKFPGTVSPERVARDTYLGYRLGLPLVTPGVLPSIAALATSIIPDAVLTPLVGWLLKRRY